MEGNLKILLIKNLERLMKGKFANVPELAKHCYWLSGPKKGAKISLRNVRYVFDERPESPSPSLACLEGVADALGASVWEVMIDLKAERAKLLKKLFNEGEEAS